MSRESRGAEILGAVATSAGSFTLLGWYALHPDVTLTE